MVEIDTLPLIIFTFTINVSILA